MGSRMGVSSRITTFVSRKSPINSSITFIINKSAILFSNVFRMAVAICPGMPWLVINQPKGPERLITNRMSAELFADLTNTSKRSGAFNSLYTNLPIPKA
jgi:hypothetical protein